MIQLDSRLGLTTAPALTHGQRTLQPPDQIVSASGRDQNADACGAKLATPHDIRSAVRV